MPINIYRAKLIIIGEATVGKTALTQMFVTDGAEFVKNYTMTLAAEVYAKTVPISDTDDSVELHVYDSPSNDLYVDYLNMFWNRPDLLMIVYDLTNKQSLENVTKWCERAKNTDWKTGSPLEIVLFGNKSDLVERICCKEEDATHIMEQNKMKHFTGSAKTNDGIASAFKHLAEVYYKKNAKRNL